MGERFLNSSFVLGVGLIIALGGCGGGGGEETAVVENFAVAYVKRPVPAPGDAVDVRDAAGFHPGADLYVRNLAAPGAPEKNVTFAVTGGAGDVKDVEVSYDGGRLVFAMRAPADPDATAQPTWNIWEYDFAADRLHRVIASDTVAEEGEDIAPHYLPDGRIVFSSTRQRQSKAVLLDESKPQFAALDENLNQPAAVLHVMNADGSDIQQISFNQSDDLSPSVLGSGEIVFSRWNHFGSRDEISLYAIRPDGTELYPLYGGNSHATGTPGSTVQFLRALERSSGRLLSLIRPFSGTDGGGNVVDIDVENFLDSDRPVASRQGTGGSGQSPLLPDDIRTDAAPSPGGRFASAWPLADGTSRVLASWSLCRLIENGVIVPCTAQRLAAPTAVEAPPLYGVYVFDPAHNTRRPVVPPQEGVMVSDVAALQPRPLPAILADKVAGAGLDPTLIDEGVGVLDIRSVYDFDGTFNALGSSAAAIAQLADPARTAADQRPARFLRLVKAVSIPGREVIDLPGTAFGASTQQKMREIIGYAPIEPDGSVRIKVPANIAFEVSVLDRSGRRIGARHQYWIQLRPGETVHCNGCHTAASGGGHGSPRGPASIYPGSTSTGVPFPNTDPALFTDFGDTMAETRTRIDPTAMTLSTDLVYQDVWTDAAAAGRPKDAAFAVRYADLATPAPAEAGCQTAWQSQCRIVINYEEHIHPLWGRDRGADTCTGCHGTQDAMGNPQVPAAQLDLGDGPSAEQPAHLKSYRQLLFAHNEQEVVNGVLQDRLVQATDAQGNPLFELDGQGNLVPVMVTVSASPAMTTAGAAASSRFFSRFAAGASHDGRLQPAELKLISEWLDIGAQYYNDPFAAVQQ